MSSVHLHVYRSVSRGHPWISYQYTCQSRLHLTTHNFRESGCLHLEMQAPTWGWHLVSQMGGDPHLHFPPKHKRGKPGITCFTHTARALHIMLRHPTLQYDSMAHTRDLAIASLSSHQKVAQETRGLQAPPA